MYNISIRETWLKFADDIAFCAEKEEIFLKILLQKNRTDRMSSE